MVSRVPTSVSTYYYTLLPDFVINKCIMTYLEEKNMLPNQQYGFQTGLVNEDHVFSLSNVHYKLQINR